MTVLALLIGLGVSAGPGAAAADDVQAAQGKSSAAANQSGSALVRNSPADDQYGEESPPAGASSKPGQSQDVFTPPSAPSGTEVASVSQALPLTGAALLLPSVVGVILLGLGIVLLYRTRRREH